MQQRLDKLVADRLCITRKESRALIRRGLVSVGGEPVTAPDHKYSGDERITADGRELHTARQIYLMLDKPRGILTATGDRRDRTVLDLVPPALLRKNLFPAGRLDKDTEGFVLLTDDGAFGHRITSPRNHIPKTYRVRLDAPADFAAIGRAFAQGVDLGGGDHASPSELTLLASGPEPLCELVIYEGVYHQVKRMFEQFGRRVVWLRRVQIGGLVLDDSLGPGGCREITADERSLLLAKDALQTR